MGTRTRIAAIGAAVALLGSACGESGEQVSTATTSGERTTTTTIDPTSTTQNDGTSLAERLAATAERVEEAGSGRFVMTLRIRGLPEVGDVEFGMEGAFDADGRAHMRMDLGPIMAAAMAADPEAAGDPLAEMFAELFAEPIEVVVDGETTYIRMGFLASFLGAETEWVSSPTEDGATSDFTGFGVPGSDDPTAFLETLEDVGAEVEELGTDDINGVEAMGYRVLIDLETAAASLGGDADLDGLSEEVLAQEMPMEVWLTEDGLPVRIAMEFGEELTAAFDETGDMQGASMDLTIDFLDLGEPVDIEIPDPDDVTPMEDLGSGLADFGDDEGSEGE